MLTRSFFSWAQSMAMNALLGGKQSGSHSGSSNNFGGLANTVLSGLTHSGGSGGHGSSGGQSGSGGLGGKLVGQLASNLFSSGNSKPPPQTYHGAQTAQHQSSGGLAGSMMGGVAHMFGGQSHGSVSRTWRQQDGDGSKEEILTVAAA